MEGGPVKHPTLVGRGFPGCCIALLIACGSSAGVHGGAPPPAPATTASGAAASPPTNAPGEASSVGLIPEGYGSLRQDEVAIRLSMSDISVRLIPLDESVIRVLAPDSYRALRQLVDSRRDQLDQLARAHGLQAPQVWYVTFFGLAAESRFTPTDLTVTSAGREFRPLEILPLSSGFSEQRLQARETRSALYLFEDGLDDTQPLTVAMGTARSADWQGILLTIERERALIRSRAARAKRPN
jgi:hypothetical protein